MSLIPKRELDGLERELRDALSDQRGRSYTERQQLALNYLRVIVERHIRETERRMGHRSEYN